MTPLRQGAGYFDQVYYPETLIASAKRAIGDWDFDTMVGTGLSGALAIPMLAHALDKHWAIVRKPNEISHSGAVIEGRLGEKWIFVDDFIASGRTFDRVYKTIQKQAIEHDWTTTYSGAYMYNHDLDYPLGHWRTDGFVRYAEEDLERERIERIKATALTLSEQRGLSLQAAIASVPSGKEAILPIFKGHSK